MKSIFDFLNESLKNSDKKDLNESKSCYAADEYIDSRSDKFDSEYDPIATGEAKEFEGKYKFKHGMECEIEIVSSDVILWYRLSNGEEENWRGEGVANDFVKDCCMIKHNNMIDHKTKGEPIMSNDEIVQQVLDDLY